MGIKKFFRRLFNPKDKEGRPLGDTSNATYQNVGASYGAAGGAGLGVLQPDGVVAKDAVRAKPAATNPGITDAASTRAASTAATEGTTSTEKTVGRKETAVAPTNTTELSKASEGRVEDQLYSTQVCTGRGACCGVYAVLAADGLR